MKYVDIVIATRRRPEKLIKAVESIPPLHCFNLHIIFDGDFEGFKDYVDLIEDGKAWQGEGLFVKCMSHRGSVACRNKIIQGCKDAVLYAVDDIVFQPGAIESAFNSMIREFPDEDGVVGFNQFNAPGNNFCWTGIALVGQKFLQRYPDKLLFNPQYWHFATREVEWLSVRLGKLYKDPEARIYHYHPDFYHDARDRTHDDARIHKAKDMQIKESRRSQKKIWGMNEKDNKIYNPDLP